MVSHWTPRVTLNLVSGPHFRSAATRPLFANRHASAASCYWLQQCVLLIKMQRNVLHLCHIQVSHLLMSSCNFKTFRNSKKTMHGNGKGFFLKNKNCSSIVIVVVYTFLSFRQVVASEGVKSLDVNFHVTYTNLYKK